MLDDKTKLFDSRGKPPWCMFCMVTWVLLRTKEKLAAGVLTPASPTSSQSILTTLDPMSLSGHLYENVSCSGQM